MSRFKQFADLLHKNPLITSSLVVAIVILLGVTVTFLIPSNNFNTSLIDKDGGLSLLVSESPTATPQEKITVPANTDVTLHWKYNEYETMSAGGALKAFVQHKAISDPVVSDMSAFSAMFADPLDASKNTLLVIDKYQKVIQSASEAEVLEIKAIVNQIEDDAEQSALIIADSIDHTVLKDSFNKHIITINNNYKKALSMLSTTGTEIGGSKSGSIVPEDIETVKQELTNIHNQHVNINKKLETGRVWSTIHHVTSTNGTVNWIASESSDFRIIALNKSGSISDNAQVMTTAGGDDFDMDFQINGSKTTVITGAGDTLIMSWDAQWNPPKMSPLNMLFIQEYSETEGKWMDVYAPTVWTGTWETSTDTDTTYRMLLNWNKQEYIEEIAVEIRNCTPYYAKYDFNDDSILNQEDADFIMDVWAGTETCPAVKDCDPNHDGDITTADATRLMLIANGDFDDGDVCSDLIDNNCNGSVNEGCGGTCEPFYAIYDYNDDALLNSDDVAILTEIVSDPDASCPAGKECDLTDEGGGTRPNVFDIQYLQEIISGAIDNGEVCDDSIDNNCDGTIDEGCTPSTMEITLKANGDDESTTIQPGDAATLTWSTSEDPSTIFMNGKTYDSPGELKVTPDKTTTFTAYNRNPDLEILGSLYQDDVTVVVEEQVLSLSLKANGEDESTTILPGGTATLSWTTSEDPSSVYLDGTIYNSPGELQVTPDETTTYTAYNRNPYLEIDDPLYQDDVTVVVEEQDKPITLLANGEDEEVSVEYGEVVTLEWSTMSDPATLFFLGEEVDSPGSTEVTAEKTTTYTIYSHDPSLPIRRPLIVDMVTVKVTNPPQDITLTANGNDDKIVVQRGDKVELAWDTTYDPTSLYFEGEEVKSPGSLTIVAEETKVYTIYSHNPDLELKRMLFQDSVSVEVEDAPTCGDDPLEPNNEYTNSAPVSAGEYENLLLCNLDTDWFKIWMDAEQEFNFDAVFSHNLGDIDLYLYELDDQSVTESLVEIASSTSSDDNEKIEYTHPVSEYVYLKTNLNPAGVQNAKSTPYTLAIKNLGTTNSQIDPAKSSLTVDPVKVPVNTDEKILHFSTISVELKNDEDQPLANREVNIIGQTDLPIYCLHNMHCTGDPDSGTVTCEAICDQGYTIDPIVVTTDIQGKATSKIYANRSQTVRLSATSEGITLKDRPEVVFYNPDEYLFDLDLEPATIFANNSDSARLLLEVKNSDGTPYAGGKVRFDYTPHSGNKDMIDKIKFNPQGGELNKQGKISTNVTSMVPGTYDLQFYLDDTLQQYSIEITTLESEYIAQVQLEGRDLNIATESASHKYPVMLRVFSESDGVDESFVSWTTDQGHFPHPEGSTYNEIHDFLENLNPGTYEFTFSTLAHLPYTETVVIENQGDDINIDSDITLITGNVSQSQRAEEGEVINTMDVMWFYTVWGQDVPSYDQFDDQIYSNAYFIGDLLGDGEPGAEDFSFIIHNLNLK